MSSHIYYGVFPFNGLGIERERSREGEREREQERETEREKERERERDAQAHTRTHLRAARNGDLRRLYEFFLFGAQDTPQKLSHLLLLFQEKKEKKGGETCCGAELRKIRLESTDRSFFICIVLYNSKKPVLCSQNSFLCPRKRFL